MEKDKMILELIAHYANGNKTLFSKKLGITPQCINSWIVRKTFDIYLVYEKCENISPDWLLTGRGEMERAAGCAVEGVSIQGNNTIAESTINNVRGGGAPCCEGCEMVRMLRTQIETQNTQINKLLDVIHENGKRD